MLTGRQICNVRPGPGARHFDMLDQLFPGISLEHSYYAPEILRSGTCQLVKPPNDTCAQLSGLHCLNRCLLKFWQLPESLQRTCHRHLTICSLDFVLEVLVAHYFWYEHLQCPEHWIGSSSDGLRLPVFFVRTLVQSGANFWNRYYIDHFWKVNVTLDYFEFPRESVMSCALYSFSMSFNFMAHQFNSLVARSNGNFVRMGHLIAHKNLRDQLSDNEHAIPWELLVPLFRSML